MELLTAGRPEPQAPNAPDGGVAIERTDLYTEGRGLLQAGHLPHQPQTAQLNTGPRPPCNIAIGCTCPMSKGWRVLTAAATNAAFLLQQLRVRSGWRCLCGARCVPTRLKSLHWPWAAVWAQWLKTCGLKAGRRGSSRTLCGVHGWPRARAMVSLAASWVSDGVSNLAARAATPSGATALLRRRGQPAGVQLGPALPAWARIKGESLGAG